MGCASAKQLPRDELRTAPQPRPAIVSAADSFEEDGEPVICRTEPRLTCVRDYDLLIDGYLRLSAAFDNKNNFLIIPHLIKTYFYPRYLLTPISSCLDDLSADEFQRLFDLSHELSAPTSLSTNNMQWHIRCASSQNGGAHYLSEAGLTQFDSIHYHEYGVEGEIDVISSGICATHTFVASSGDHGQYIYYSTLLKSTRSKKRKFYNLINLPFNNQNERVTEIRCGYEYCLFLTEQGVVWGRGTNQYGQIGQHKGIVHIPTMSKIEYELDGERGNHEIPKIRAICCGYDQSLMIDIYDNLWIFGHTSHGQLGVEPDENVIYKAICHPWFHKKHSDLRIQHISCGLRHSLCVDASGRAYLFGDNQYGQIGNGKCNTIQYTPYMLQWNGGIVYGECGEMHTVLLTGSNELVTFGRNLHGECSSLMQRFKTVSSGHVVSRELEMKINDDDVIQSIVVSKGCTVIIVNMIQTRLNRIQTDYSQLHSERD